MDGIDRHERNRSRFVAEAVVPGTGTPGEGVLYPPLQPGPSGLAKPSWALTGQVRSVDERRVERWRPLRMRSQVETGRPYAVGTSLHANEVPDLPDDALDVSVAHP